MSYNFWNDITDKSPDANTCVSNFPMNELPMYKSAIQQYDKGELLYIKEDAYDMDGNIISENMSIHCDKWMDLSDFWDIFGQIKRYK
jgi:hypothetical protein